MTRNEPLKNGYDRAYVARLAAEFQADLAAGFEFQAAVFADGWDQLELKGRMARVAGALVERLPKEPALALPMLEALAARVVAPSRDGFLAMWLPHAVGSICAPDLERHFDTGLEALARTTSLASSEFAVRPFLELDAPRALRHFQAWTASDDAHVRRLASEGSRPRLPWAPALGAFKADPRPVLPVLEALRHDSSEYVRRSVANHVNDISKDHPELVRELATRWLAERPEHLDTRRLVKHACRTLLKAADSQTLALFGYAEVSGLAASALVLSTPRLARGDVLEFTCRVKSSGAPLGRLRVEYLVHFQKANGSLRPKVFQLAEFDEPRAVREVRRRHAFRDLSTRKHFPGPHRIELRMNGRVLAGADFELT